MCGHCLDVLKCIFCESGKNIGKLKVQDMAVFNILNYKYSCCHNLYLYINTLTVENRLQLTFAEIKFL